MRKTIMGLCLFLAVLVPAASLASTSYTKGLKGHTEAKIACTTGSETSTPPTTDPCSTSTPQGLCLAGLGGFTVHLEAASTFSAGGYLAAYLWNPASEQWNRAPDLDLYVDSALTDQSWAGFAVVSSAGGIAYLPQGAGAFAMDIHIIASRSR